MPETGNQQTEGLEAAIRDRAQAALVPQPALLPLGLPPEKHPNQAGPRRKAGRPPGARNRRTEDVAREIIERLGDPLVELVALATMPVAELMAHGLTLEAALAEKRLAAIGALPYLHQRKSPEAVVNFQLPNLVMADPATFLPAQTVEGQIEEIQDLSEVPDAPV